MPIQIMVNHSGMLGPVRSQRQRSTCMAFAMSDLNRSVAGVSDVLSAEFLYQAAGALTLSWMPGMGLRSMEAILATQSPGQPFEIHFPYQAHDPATVAMPVPPTGQTLFTSQICTQNCTMPSIVAELSRGKLVGLVIRVTQGLFNPISGVVPHENAAIPNQYHAVLAVGYGTHQTGTYSLLIRNSWGVGWGLSGYGWLPERFVNLHVLEVFGS